MLRFWSMWLGLVLGVEKGGGWMERLRCFGVFVIELKL
jgi:hypothetical protein